MKNEDSSTSKNCHKSYRRYMVVVPSIEHMAILQRETPHLFKSCIFHLERFIEANSHMDSHHLDKSRAKLPLQYQSIHQFNHLHNTSKIHNLLSISELQKLCCGEVNTHLIDLNPDKHGAYFSMLTVSIAFHGCFVTTGKPTTGVYRPGKIRARLFASSGETTVSTWREISKPNLIIPYNQQTLNTPECLGQIVLQLRPNWTIEGLEMPISLVLNREPSNTHESCKEERSHNLLKLELKGYTSPNTFYTVHVTAVECEPIDDVLRRSQERLQRSINRVPWLFSRLQLCMDNNRLKHREAIVLKTLLLKSAEQSKQKELDLKEILRLISFSRNEDQIEKETIVKQERRKVKLELEYINSFSILQFRTRLSLLNRSQTSQLSSLEKRMQIFIINQKVVQRDLRLIISSLTPNFEKSCQDSNESGLSALNSLDLTTRRISCEVKIPNHNSNLAAETRLKTPAEWSLLDKEWISIDRKLNPENWDKPINFSLMRNQLTSTDGRQLRTLEELYEEAQNARKFFSAKILNHGAPVGKWDCPFTNTEIIDLWQSPVTDLMSIDELRCIRLLQHYNGAFDSTTLKNKSDQKHLEKYQNISDLVPLDTDDRCRVLLSEMDRVKSSIDKKMTSKILQTVPQIYPRSVLLSRIEAELDRLQTESILNMEQKHSTVSLSSNDCAPERNFDQSMSVLEIESLTTEAEKTAFERRSKSEKKAGSLISKIDAFKNYLIPNRKGIVTYEKDFLGCSACRHSKCLWISCEEVQKLSEIKLNLKGHLQELHFSTKASLNLNGCLEDSVLELNKIYRQIDERIQLAKVDKELHDVYAINSAFFEVTSLHGFATIHTKESAMIALESECRKLIAVQLARETLNDILQG